MKRKHNDDEGAEGDDHQLQHENGDDQTAQPELPEPSAKRRRPSHDDDNEYPSAYTGADEYSHQAQGGPGAGEPAFFGMLDESEQEYFKHADELFELDSFASSEERKTLLEQVYREADGKELKIAQSQSCSRLLEKMIRVSTAKQLKGLFGKFSGRLVAL
jgi:nucleolar protein 9